MIIRPKCPRCGSTAEWHKAHNTNDPKRIFCRVCVEYFNHPDAPKVLLFDIETSRIKANLYQAGKQVVRHEQITDDFFVTMWAGKWLFEKESFGAAVTPKESKRRDDKRVMAELDKEIKKADFVITYNGNKFDIKKINWRFLIHRIPPNNKYQSIDLYRRAKDTFAPASLALDFVTKELGYNGKHHTDWAMWDAVEAGDPEAIERAYQYCKNDVWMLEDIYPRIRGWFKTHPNFGAFQEFYQTIDDKERDEYKCPRCLHPKGVIHSSKFRYKYQTPAGFFYAIAQCPNCGAWVRLTRRNTQKVYIK